MDLSRATNDKKLVLCKNYFRIGFVFLPFVWTVNAIWFYNEAFRKEEFEEQHQIKKYVIYSAMGAFLWFVSALTWIIVFQTNRVKWGEFADDISFIIPLGAP